MASAQSLKHFNQFNQSSTGWLKQYCIFTNEVGAVTSLEGQV